MYVVSACLRGVCFDNKFTSQVYGVHLDTPIAQMGIPEPQHPQQASWPTTYLFITLPVLLFLSYVVYLHFLSPTSSIPGPFFASISRLWLLKHSWDGDMHRTMITLHAKHGKLVRTGPDEVSVSDLTAIKKIYGAGTKFRKSDWYSVWQGHRKFDLFAERDERIHGTQRRLVSGIYAMNSLVQYQGQVDDAIVVMVEQMQKKGGEIVDLGVWLQLFAFGKYSIVNVQVRVFEFFTLLRHMCLGRPPQQFSVPH